MVHVVAKDLMEVKNFLSFHLKIFFIQFDTIGGHGGRGHDGKNGTEGKRGKKKKFLFKN